MSYLRAVFRDLDTLDRWHRESLTPEQRAAEDRFQRRQAIKDTALGVAVFAAMGSVTLLPWAVGAWSLGSWLVRKAS